MEEDIMKILAFIVIVFSIITFVLSPLLIGRNRGEYTYGIWISHLIETIIIILLSLRVLEII